MHIDNKSIDPEFDMFDYNSNYYQIASCPPGIWAERSLWCAVIEQAFIDIDAIVSPTSNKKESGKMVPTFSLPVNAHSKRNKAIDWLLHDTQDFMEVCYLAGVSPAVIRFAAQQFVFS